jgi:hypothetical protein
MRERWDCGQWLYRRDQTIQRPLAEAIGSRHGSILISLQGW